MSKVKSVNVDRILKTMDMSQIENLINYHINLKKRRVFGIDQQSKFIHKINEYIKTYLVNEKDQEVALRFYMNLILYYVQNNLFDLKILSERAQNPLTDFIMDCEDTLVYKSNAANSYIHALIDNGDDQLPPSLFDVFERCPVPGLKANQNQ
jgi:hypothetical protein